MKIGTKILASVAIAIGIASAVSLIIQRHLIKKQGIELAKKEMQSIILEAETVRENSALLITKNAFDFDRLKQELTTAKSYKDTTIFNTIPVISAINALRQVSLKQNLIFRVVREKPRNLENTPDDYELKILRALDKGDSEFYEINEAKGYIYYARPIVLSSDCLMCHGDPKNSPTKDGKDIIGFQMENWNAGEVRGAFILAAPLSKIDEVVKAGFTSLASWLGIVVVSIILAFYFLIKTSIIKPLLKSIDICNQSSEEAAKMSLEISAVSHSLAEGSSEQAASLEETSASLEEITSLTQSNAVNAGKAKNLSAETKTSADLGHASMKEMSKAMIDIQSSSDNVAQVIKTIEEIAFQTNILALNAAVEAARAGEAGLGFAVVADEVRNLAQRCAEAAQNTSRLIDRAKESANKGNKICEQVNQNLEEIVKMVNEVNSHVVQVAESSQEQNQGTSQVRSAVIEMDKVTNRTATNAEQTASASAALSEQATTLRTAIKDLYNLIHGNKNR